MEEYILNKYKEIQFCNQDHNLITYCRVQYFAQYCCIFVALLIYRDYVLF